MGGGTGSRITYFLYTCQGYVRALPDGNLVDVARVSVIANNEKEALQKVRKLVKKEFWRVSDVIEYIDNGKTS